MTPEVKHHDFAAVLTEPKRLALNVLAVNLE